MRFEVRRASAPHQARSLALSLALGAAGACSVQTPGEMADHRRPTAARAPPAASSNDGFRRAASADNIERFDLVNPTGDVAAAMRSAGLPDRLAGDLDGAFVHRVDLFAHVRDRVPFTIWVRDGSLVAAQVAVGRAKLFAANYDGAGAPHAFYDARGSAMTGKLLARPVPLTRITSRFGQRFDAFTGAPSLHHGIDYGVPRGTPVVAVGRGKVKGIGTSPSAGNFIKVAHADGYESLYLHLDAIEPDLRVGSVVDQGDVIAESGNTGRSTGPHLHYELHLAGIPVDPLATLPMPTVALGPLARREHLAFLNQLEAMHDRREDQQDEHPRARP